MEKLEMYDDNKKKTGRVIVRGVGKPLEGEHVLLSVIYVRYKDKYLIQKVSKNKSGVYAVPGGHVSFGNTSKEQAVIECQEEMGIKLDINKLKYLGDLRKESAIFDVYLYDLEKFIPETDFVVQESEVEKVCWLTKKEIDKLIEENVFRESSIKHYLKFIK